MLEEIDEEAFSARSKEEQLEAVIPPEKQGRQRWNFLVLFSEDVSHENITVHRQPDHRGLKGSRSRHASARALPCARDWLSDVLQMAVQVRWYGRVDGRAHEGA